MFKKVLLLLFIAGANQYACAQQYNFVFGIGSAVWTPEGKNMDGTRFNVKTPFADFFRNINLWKPHLGLGIGLGITSYNMPLNNFIAVDSSKHVTFSGKDFNDVKKYKLNTTYVELPVELRYRQATDKHKHIFRLSLGMKLCLLVSSHTKAKYNSFASQTKLKEYNISYLNDLTYGPYISIGWGSIALYAYYDIRGLFDENYAALIHQSLIALCLSIPSRPGSINIPNVPLRPRTETADNIPKSDLQVTALPKIE